MPIPASQHPHKGLDHCNYLRLCAAYCGVFDSSGGRTDPAYFTPLPSKKSLESDGAPPPPTTTNTSKTAVVYTPLHPQQLPTAVITAKIACNQAVHSKQRPCNLRVGGHKPAPCPLHVLRLVQASRRSIEGPTLAPVPGRSRSASPWSSLRMQTPRAGDGMCPWPRGSAGLDRIVEGESCAEKVVSGDVLSPNFWWNSSSAVLRHGCQGCGTDGADH